MRLGPRLSTKIWWLFAFSSVIGNYYYGEANVLYITKKPVWLFLFRLSVAAIVMVGSLMTLDMAWCLSDLTMAMIAVFNLAAITLLSRQAVFLLKDYVRQRREGRDPVFRKESMPDVADRLEAW